eukprot:TRINITY_DN4273_c0_g1_i1.p1 TRINITY_DN4273_c0_g1~~TRINITY_DN4273_c0_g1_i1.p1  ORF type:complete len:392 (+),score=87.42 TRINITY_DN4273_c0_g1_i1:149-1324(+)
MDVLSPPLSPSGYQKHTPSKWRLLPIFRVRGIMILLVIFACACYLTRPVKKPKTNEELARRGDYWSDVWDRVYDLEKGAPSFERQDKSVVVPGTIGKRTLLKVNGAWDFDDFADLETDNFGLAQLPSPLLVIEVDAPTSFVLVTHPVQAALSSFSIEKDIKLAPPAIVTDTLALLKDAPEKSLIIDVGVGNGAGALAAASLGHKVLVFEAAKENARVVSFGSMANGFEDRITVNRAMLADTIGMIEVAVPSTFVPSLASVYADNAAVQLNGADIPLRWEDVRMIRLDHAVEWVSLSDDIFLLRINARGYEMNAVKGAHYILKAGRVKNFLVNIWPRGLKSANVAPLDLLRFIASFGFRIKGHEGISEDAHNIYLRKLAKETVDDFVHFVYV